MDLSDKDGLRWLSVILDDLKAGAPGVDFLIVGATARDLLLHYGYGVPIARATRDVDLGVAVAGWEDFQRLRDACLESGHFSSGRPAGHRLIHRIGVSIDLIPFGGVERDDGSIEWPDDGAVMGVLGYREADATAVRICLPNDTSIATVCLPMFAVLKLMAWSERHTRAPRKDASDLFLVLSNYLNGENAQRLYEVGAHLLENEDFDYDEAGAWLVGHDAARCIVDHSREPMRVLDGVEEILEAEVDPHGNLRLVGEMGRQAEGALRLLGGFRNGIRDAQG